MGGTDVDAEGGENMDVDSPIDPNPSSTMNEIGEEEVGVENTKLGSGEEEKGENGQDEDEAGEDEEDEEDEEAEAEGEGGDEEGEADYEEDEDGDDGEENEVEEQNNGVTLGGNSKGSMDDGELKHESDGDDEGEEDEDEDEIVGAVKLPNGVEPDSEEDDDIDTGSDEGSEVNAEDNDDSSETSSSAGSAVPEEWEAASGGEGDADVANRNCCIFCKQDEEHDPSEEFEEYLACSICGDNAHRQCAREAKSLAVDEEAENWRCPSCIENALEPDSPKSLRNGRPSTSHSVPRDLLPGARGAPPKPGSHSIFNSLIVDDDPLDGSRPLRKRKASSEAFDTQSRTSSKRRKGKLHGESESEPSLHSLPDDDIDILEANGKGLLAELNSLGHTEKGAGNPSSRTRTRGQPQAMRTTRPRRQKAEPSKARLLLKDRRRLILAFKVDMSLIKKSGPRQRNRRPAPLSSHTRFAHTSTTLYAPPLYSLHDRETDESKLKPYGGILTEEEADTSKTFPMSEDRAKFDEAKRRHEEEWRVRTAASEAENEIKGRANQKVSGPPSKIKCISFGGYEIDTWYAAPYPEEYSRNRVLYICEYCLKYMPSDYVAWRHKLKCPAKHPPGDEIYRDKSISVFEVDGRKNPVYCQNLCLLAKLFLGSKTLYYDVEPFLFYIMTEYDELGYHFVGYFSKEKRPSSMNNVSCILTLPIHQRKGYGNLLIDFSYLLTRVEKKTGSPEKPLSDMGLVSYRNYWRLILAQTLLEQEDPLSVTEISERTGMTPDDIIAALEALRALVRDPVTKTYALRLDRIFLKETIEKWEAKGYVSLNADALVWTPYIMGRNNLASYDRGAPISTMAPREDEDEAAIANPLATQTQSAEDQPLPMLSGENFADVALIHNHQLFPDHASPPKTNGTHNPSPKLPSPIPPTRYEIYPPVPGTAFRRRKGGSRRVQIPITPAALALRRSDRPPGGSRSGTRTPRTNGGFSPRHATTPTSRKTRSALGAEIGAAVEVKGAAKKTEPDTEEDEMDEDEDDEEGDAVKAEDGARIEGPENGNGSDADEAADHVDGEEDDDPGIGKTDEVVTTAPSNGGVDEEGSVVKGEEESESMGQTE